MSGYWKVTNPYDPDMTRELTVQDHITIVGVSPQQVFEAVSDPSQMGRWSPENTGAVIDTAGSPAPVGTSFVGSNSRRGARWHTRCVVTASDPGHRFAFDVTAIGLMKPRLRSRIATWEYRFEEAPRGTLVTEIWSDGRREWPTFLANAFDKIVTRGSTFADFQRRNVARTLVNLKKELEMPAR